MTPRFLADEHIHPQFVLGLKRRAPEADIVRVQDVGLRTLDDPTILQWAADEGRALITRDRKTIPTFAHQRVAAGKAMPGVFALRQSATMALVIDELAMIAGASDADEWVNRIIYVPLR